MKRVLLVAAGVFAVDWITKAVVLLVAPAIIAPDYRPMGWLGLVGLPVMAWYGSKRVHSPKFLRSVGLILGGGYANGIQRLFGPVINFIPLPNSTADVADLCLMAGVALLFVSGLGRLRRRGASNSRSALTSENGGQGS